jgi:phosphoglycerate dehydrogenase-like enzyme
MSKLIEGGGKMKLLVIGSKERTEKYLPDLPIVSQVEIVVAPRGASNAEILALGADADFILADAISTVDAELMAGMPNLKLVHSEGVAYNAIDVEAARARGVAVCNNAGVNASAVAEQTVLLMLACLRSAGAGDAAVRAGQQIQMKERLMVEGIKELGDCRVGFIGFGAIAQATAARLGAWGCTMLYNKRHALDPAREVELGVTFATQDEIARTCDIISLHVPVTPETKGLVNAEFLASTRPGSIIINTARGEIVDQPALAAALESGHVGAAGFDTLSPEPVTLDNPLLNMSEAASARVIFSPHIGGVTEGMFYRAHKRVWENIARAATGTPLESQVV